MIKKFVVKRPASVYARFAMQRAKQIDQTISFIRDANIANISKLEAFNEDDANSTKYTVDIVRVPRPSWPIIEKEPINVRQYYDYMARKDERMRVVKVSHFKMIHGNYVCTLQNFDHHLFGLSIVEVSDVSLADDCFIPPYMTVIADITSDHRFNTMSLAKPDTNLETLLQSIERGSE